MEQASLSDSLNIQGAAHANGDISEVTRKLRATFEHMDKHGSGLIPQAVIRALMKQVGTPCDEHGAELDMSLVRYNDFLNWLDGSSEACIGTPNPDHESRIQNLEDKIEALEARLARIPAECSTDSQKLVESARASSQVVNTAPHQKSRALYPGQILMDDFQSYDPMSYEEAYAESTKNGALERLIAFRDELLDSSTGQKPSDFNNSCELKDPLQQVGFDISTHLQSTIAKAEMAGLVANLYENDAKLRKGFTVQPVFQHYVPDLDSLYNRACSAQESFDAKVMKCATLVEARFALAPVKKKQRCRMKARFKYMSSNGKSTAWYRLTDLNRATLVFDTIDAMYKALYTVIDEFQGKVIELNDRYATPLPGAAGYRDIQLQVDHAGVVCEIQLNTFAMLQAKETSGHRSYDVRRELEATVANGECELCIDTLEWGLEHLGNSATELSNVLNSAGRGGATLLHTAAEHGYAEIIFHLLGKRADSNMVDNDGNTPLHLALNGGHDQVTWALLDTGGADWNKANKKGDTALLTGYLNFHRYPKDEQAAKAICTLAYWAGAQHLREILDKRAAAEQRERFVSTEMVNFAADGRTAAVRKCLQEFADPNSQRDGVPALVIAAERNHPEVLELLLQYKASLELSNLERLNSALDVVPEDDRNRMMIAILERSDRALKFAFKGHIDESGPSERNVCSYDDAILLAGGLASIEKNADIGKSILARLTHGNEIEQVLNAKFGCEFPQPLFQHYEPDFEMHYRRGFQVLESFDSVFRACFKDMQGVTVGLVPLKSRRRCQTKAETDYAFSSSGEQKATWYRLCDIVRAYALFESFDDMYQGLQRVAGKFEVRKLRDSAQVPFEVQCANIKWGYREVQIIVDHQGHLCEIQLQAKALWEYVMFHDKRARQAARLLESGDRIGFAALMSKLRGEVEQMCSRTWKEVEQFLDTQHEAGNAFLHIAAQRGNAEIISTLLDHHANPNLQNDEGNTPLHLALQGGHCSATWVLLDRGKAKWHVRNHKGALPLQMNPPEVLARNDEARFAVAALAYHAGVEHVREAFVF